MFTPSLTVSKTMWLTLKHAGHKNTCSILLHSFCVRKFLPQIVLDVHTEIQIGLKWCVNYCYTWTKTGTLINFCKLPNKKKFCENLYRGLSSYMQTHTDKQAYWSKETYCYKTSLQICQKNYWSFLEMLPVVEQLKSMPNLPIKHSC